MATNCGQIKTGSLSRSDVGVKFPASSRRRLRLLRIEQQLGKNVGYADRNALPNARR